MLHLHFLQTTWSAVAWVICKSLHQKIFHLERERDRQLDREIHVCRERQRERETERDKGRDGGRKGNVIKGLIRVPLGYFLEGISFFLRSFLVMRVLLYRLMMITIALPLPSRRSTGLFCLLSRNELYKNYGLIYPTKQAF